MLLVRRGHGRRYRKWCGQVLHNTDDVTCHYRFGVLRDSRGFRGAVATEVESYYGVAAGEFGGDEMPDVVGLREAVEK